jgi:hypothetical protein
MKKIVLILTGLALMFSSLKLVSQNSNAFVNGQIIDNISKKPIPYAKIMLKDSGKLFATISDFDGTFNMFNVTEGKHLIQISHSEYNDVVKEIKTTNDNNQKIILALNKTKSKPEEQTITDDNYKLDFIRSLLFKSNFSFDFSKLLQINL